MQLVVRASWTRICKFKNQTPLQPVLAHRDDLGVSDQTERTATYSECCIQQHLESSSMLHLSSSEWVWGWKTAPAFASLTHRYRWLPNPSYQKPTETKQNKDTTTKKQTKSQTKSKTKESKITNKTKKPNKPKTPKPKEPTSQTKSQTKDTKITNNTTKTKRPNQNHRIPN